VLRKCTEGGLPSSGLYFIALSLQMCAWRFQMAADVVYSAENVMHTYLSERRKIMMSARPVRTRNALALKGTVFTRCSHW
jgi:hypothetical protein